MTALGVSLVSTQATALLQDAGQSNPDSNFRFDAALGGYIFNLSTAGYASGSYLLSFRAGSDPTLHTLPFQVK